MRVTKHAVERIKERNIKPADVAYVLEHGKRMVNRHDNNKYTFVNYEMNLYVVTDKAMTAVITVFRKER